MSVQERVQHDMREALRARDEFRLGVLRMLNAALGNREIEKHAQCVRAGIAPGPLTDQECWEVFHKEHKQRKESAAAFAQGGRTDLRDTELKEAEIVAQYLPQMLSEDEIRSKVQQAVASLKSSGTIERGAVMKALSQELKGKADMALVARMVGETLGS